MNQQTLRKANSEAFVELNKYKKEELESEQFSSGTIDEVKQAECGCCGLKEECTPGYIDEVSGSFSGNWVCGLCSEAVKEKMRRASASPNGTAMQEAVRSHREFCQRYKTARLNPKLSLTLSMRDIAKKSSENRNSFNSNMPMSSMKLGRRSSCGPTINF